MLAENPVSPEGRASCWTLMVQRETTAALGEKVGTEAQVSPDPEERVTVVAAGGDSAPVALFPASPKVTPALVPVNCLALDILNGPVVYYSRAPQVGMA